MMMTMENKREIANRMNMEIYLTNLGKYNEGELVGEWVNLPVSEDELNNVMDRIGINEEYEEYFITDWEISEDLEGLIDVKEYSNIDTLNELAETISELDEYDLELVGAIARTREVSLEDAIDLKDDVMYFSSDSECNEDIAYGYIDSIGNLECALGDRIVDYFDYESFGCNLSHETYELLGDEYDQIYTLKSDKLELEDELEECEDSDEREYIKERIEELEEEIEELQNKIDDIENMGYCDLAEWYIEMFGSVEDLGAETLERYFDYDAYGRDLLMEMTFDGATGLVISDY